MVRSRDRLRHVGHGRLDRLRRRGVAARRSTGRSRSAATSSTPPGPTATATASGCSAKLLARHPGTRLYIATKIPPKNLQVARRARTTRSTRCSPPTTSASTPRRASRTSACRPSTCSSSTCGATRGPTTTAGSARLDDLKDERLVRALRHQRQPLGARPTCCGRSTRASSTRVQVVYNVFDQAPEDELFPYCQAHGIAVIARVPFDEGSLTGTLTADIDLARGRLAQPLLHARTTCADARRASTGCGRSCRRA